MEKREVPENPVIKAVFFDVDGTLLSIESNQVPDSAKEAVKKLRQNGILAVVATARHMTDLEKMPVKDMDFDGYRALLRRKHLSDHGICFGKRKEPVR